MRKLLVIAVIVLVAMLCGWLTFERSPGRASFTIETQKMSDDAKRALDEGKKMLPNKSDQNSEPATD